MLGREAEAEADNLFSYVWLKERAPADYPLRPIWALTDEVLAGVNSGFEGLYSRMGQSLDPTGDAAAGHAAAGVLLGAHRADAVGANQSLLIIP